MTLEILGGARVATARPAAVSFQHHTAGRRMQVFARASDGSIVSIKGLTGAWSQWESLGNTVKVESAPVAVTGGPYDSQVFVFAIGSYSSPHQILFRRFRNDGARPRSRFGTIVTAVNQDVWDPWRGLSGAYAGDPCAVGTADAVTVLARATTGEVVAQSLAFLSAPPFPTLGPDETWSELTIPGGVVHSSPSAASVGGDGILVVARRGNGVVWARLSSQGGALTSTEWQPIASDGAPEGLAGDATPFLVAPVQWGTPTYSPALLFARLANGQLAWNSAAIAANGEVRWGSWRKTPAHVASDPAAATAVIAAGPGQLETLVFARDASGNHPMSDMVFGRDQALSPLAASDMFDVAAIADGSLGMLPFHVFGYESSSQSLVHLEAY